MGNECHSGVPGNSRQNTVKMEAPKPPPFANWRLLFTFVFYVLPSASVRIPGAIIRACLKRLPLGPAIWNGFAGALMANTPPSQLQAVLPSTIDVYDAWVASHGASRAVEILPTDESTHLLWIGPKKSRKVILFFHGMMFPLHHLIL